MSDTAVNDADQEIDFKSVIERALSWRKGRQLDYFVAKLPDGYSVALHASALKSVDERLPIAMAHMVSDDHGDADVVRVTLLHWADPQPFLRKFVRDAKHYTTAIEGWLAPAAEGNARLIVMHYSIDSLAGGIEFANGFKGRRVLEVPHSELETEYPGCLQRFQCLQALGLSTEALMAQVFNTQSGAAEVELPYLSNETDRAGCP